MPAQQRSQIEAAARRKEALATRLRALAAAMEIPAVSVRVALSFYEDAIVDKMRLRGRRMDRMAAVLLYIASSARPLRDFAAPSGVPEARLERTYWRVAQAFLDAMPEVTTQSYLQHYCTQLELSREACLIALRLANLGESGGLFQRQPPTAIAASIVFLVATFSGVQRSLKDISDMSGVSLDTLRTLCTRLQDNRDALYRGTAQQ